MIKVILIDDELKALKSLKWEIEHFCRDVEVLDCFTDPLESIAAIDYLKPDCIFLDIEMPKMDGFQLLSTLSFREFELIITTAYDAYALKAFKEGAVDYLLKPIDSDDLVKAVNKVKGRKSKNEIGHDLQIMLAKLQEKTKPNKIALPSAGKVIFVYTEEIIYCKSDGNYTEVYMNNGQKEVLSKQLKEVEIIIDSNQFIRVHNSYIVNRQYINEYIKSDGQYLVLDNDITIPIARTRKSAVLKFLTD